MSCSFLAVLFVTATYGQLADNVPLNGATKCDNYIRVGNVVHNLYPVGTCYSENTDETEVDTSNKAYDGQNIQNMQWSCFATDNGTEACEQRMDIGCNGVVYTDESSCRPCNGADDQCECEVGEDASECTFYEEKSYNVDIDLNTWSLYCSAAAYTLQRTVVNMCIQIESPDSTIPGWSYAYLCGGYDDRFGSLKLNQQPFESDVIYHETADCSRVGMPTSEPSATTLSPTMAPTAMGDLRRPYCSEMTCAGNDSPRVDTRDPDPYEPFVNYSDPGCDAFVDEGEQVMFATGVCMENNATTSYMFECSSNGNIDAFMYASSDCSGVPMQSVPDYVPSMVNGTVYCDSGVTCDVAKMELYNDTLCADGPEEIHYVILNYCQPWGVEFGCNSNGQVTVSDGCDSGYLVNTTVAADNVCTDGVNQTVGTCTPTTTMAPTNDDTIVDETGTTNSPTPAPTADDVNTGSALKVSVLLPVIVGAFGHIFFL